jgi:hypothetical protein
MAKLYNLARMTTATTGTGTIALGSAVSGYLTFALAGVSNGDVVDYAIKDGSNSENGTGTYSSSGTTLTRTPTKSTNSNTAINLSGTAEVFISPRAETLNDASLLTTGTLDPGRLSATVTAHGVALFEGAGTALGNSGAGTSGQVLTSNGASTDPSFKTAAKGYLGRSVFTSSNASITPPTGATQAVYTMQAAGGGSGGTSTSGGTPSPGGGGAAIQGYIAVLSGNLTYVLGAAGTAGAAGANNGGAASASTLAMSGVTTASAPGGLGGATSGGGTAVAAAATAAPTLSNFSTDIGWKGGAAFIAVIGGACVSGANLIWPGQSYLAPWINVAKASPTAILYGQGGPATVNSGGVNTAGIAGAVGILIIDWYA